MPKTVTKSSRKQQSVGGLIGKLSATKPKTLTLRARNQLGGIANFCRPAVPVAPITAVKELLLANGFPKHLLSKAGFPNASTVVIDEDDEKEENGGLRNYRHVDNVLTSPLPPSDPLLYRDIATNLYHDLRHPHCETRSGITKTLRAAYFANFENLAKVRRVSGSGLKKGSSFHRHMYHRIMCEEMCVCVSKYGKPTKRIPGSRISAWIDQAFEALRERGLVPFACEVIVSVERIATEIDILAWHGHPSFGRLANVSLKTGYSKVGLRTARTKDGTGHMLSVLSGHVQNSDFEQHQLQQHIENLLLFRGHGVSIRPDENYVLYVGLAKNKAVIESASEWRSDPVLCEELASSFLSISSSS